jgi:UDP-glucuronate 4-epimerase
MRCALRVLKRGDDVIGIDNLNDYYDVSLKQARLAKLKPHVKFNFYQVDISDCDKWQLAAAGTLTAQHINRATEEIALFGLTIRARYPRPTNGIFGDITVIN